MRKMTAVFFYVCFFSQLKAVAAEHSFMLPSVVGRSIKQKFMEFLESSKTTTSFRKEQKNIVASKSVSSVMKILKDPVEKSLLAFKSRDKPPVGGKNMTVTLYGKRAFFWNRGIKTNLKLRSRFYLESYGPNQQRVERSSTMAKKGFLELKLKNPELRYLNVSSKIRLKVKDEDIQKLYQLASRGKSLSPLKEKIKSYQPVSEHGSLEALFVIMNFLYKIDRKFVSPMYAVSYERSSYELTEEEYMRQRKYRFLKKKNLGKVNYQITIDENVKGYYLSLEKILKEDLSSYLTKKITTEKTYHYPKDSLCLEIKKPVDVEMLEGRKRSTVHQQLEDEIVGVIMNHVNTYPGFTRLKGKLGHVRMHFQ